MYILFQTKNITLSSYDEDSMARKIENLSKFFMPDVHIYIDIDYTRGGHFEKDVYYVSLRIDSAKTQYFADEYQETLRFAFDSAFGDIFRMIRNDRSRSRQLFTRASRQFKKTFKRTYR
jgi:ribosome-associated translation inhibitor RaiA